MVDCKTRTGLCLRALLVVVFVSGIALVVLGLVVDPIPSSTLSLLLVVAGVLTSISGTIGYCASYGDRYCLGSFLILFTTTLLLQGAGILALFISVDETINHLSSNPKEQDKAKDILEKTNLVFLAVFLIECIALVCGFMQHCCCPSDFDFEAFEDSSRDQQLDLSKVRTSIGSSSFDIESGHSNKRLRQKMARKYGHLSHTTDWSQQKKWWKF